MLLWSIRVITIRFDAEKHNMACVFHSAQSDADIVTDPSQFRVGRKHQAAKHQAAKHQAAKHQAAMHQAAMLQPVQVPVRLASPPAALCVVSDLHKVVFGQ